MQWTEVFPGLFFSWKAHAVPTTHSVQLCVVPCNASYIKLVSGGSS